MVNSILEEIKRIKAIADTGLLYASNGYEKERYEELSEIAYRLLGQLTHHSLDDLKLVLPMVRDYPTAKVDIRAFVLDDQKKILLVKESADGKWSLPGGWADVGFSPGEIAQKEVYEETGLEVTTKSLLAVFDKRKHNHPPQPHYVYKLVVYCEMKSSVIKKGFDVLDAGFFSIDGLPELSEDRILKSQIELSYRKVMNADFVAHID